MKEETKYNLGILKDFIKYSFTKNKRIDLFKNNPFKIISLNLRRDVYTDKQNSWKYRKEKIVEFIKTEQPHIICSQEVMPHMYKYLLTELGEMYDGYTVASFFGCKLNYLPIPTTLGNMILYDKHKYELLDKGKFWLSTTPKIISRSWGASEPRTCVWVCLYDKNTGKKFYVFNTHLDHKSQEARENSLPLIVNKIQEIAGNYDIYLMGDFNALIEDLTPLNGAFDSTYNYNKNLTFNSFHNKLTKSLDAIYFRFGNKFNVDIPNIKISDHTPVIIYKNAEPSN